MATPRPPRTKEELVTASRHLAYEIMMLMVVAEELKRYFKKSENALAEEDGRRHQNTGMVKTGMVQGRVTYWAAAKTDPNMEPHQNTLCQNILLESFGVHARNLYHFLYSWTDKKNRVGHGGSMIKEKDVLAEDYDSSWNPKLPSSISTWIEQANWRIAHLSYERRSVSEAEKSWPTGEIVQSLKTGIEDFLRNVPDEKLHPDIILLKKDLPRWTLDVSSLNASVNPGPLPKSRSL